MSPDRRKERGKKLPSAKERRPAPAPRGKRPPETAFRRFALSEPLVRGAAEAGYLDLTPLQERMVPAALEGRNVFAHVPEGTGRTCAYMLPALARIERAGVPQILVLVADPRAAAEVAKEALRLGRFQAVTTVACLDGRRRGAAEAADLRGGPTVVVGLPEHVEAHAESGALVLDSVVVVVIDDVDGLVAGGTRSALDAVMTRVSNRRQTLILTTDDSPEAESLAARHAADAVRFEVDGVPTAGRPGEDFFSVESASRLGALEAIVAASPTPRGVVVVRNKLVTDRVLERLLSRGARALHGGLPAPKRERVTKEFLAGRFPWLVASDAASREVDLPRAGHVINYDVPELASDYARRLAWVAPMGRAGRLTTLVIPEQVALLAAISTDKASRVVPLQGFEPKAAAPDRRRKAKVEGPWDRWVPNWAGPKGKRR